MRTPTSWRVKDDYDPQFLATWVLCTHCHSGGPNAAPNSPEVTIPLLHIALQEGFDDDAVVIRLNGKEVFNQPKVRTRLQTGYAGSFETMAPTGTGRLEVAVPLRTLASAMELEVAGPTYVGVSLEPSGTISYRVQREPFGYV